MGLQSHDGLVMDDVLWVCAHLLSTMVALFIYGSQAANKMPGYRFLLNGPVKDTSPGLSPSLSALTALGLGLPSVGLVGGFFWFQ